jgi:hypothetical protein
MGLHFLKVFAYHLFKLAYQRGQLNIFVAIEWLVQVAILLTPIVEPGYIGYIALCTFAFFTQPNWTQGLECICGVCRRAPDILFFVLCTNHNHWSASTQGRQSPGCASNGCFRCAVRPSKIMLCRSLVNAILP